MPMSDRMTLRSLLQLSWLKMPSSPCVHRCIINTLKYQPNSTCLVQLKVIAACLGEPEMLSGEHMGVNGIKV